jgi:hypothetical protein
METVRNIQNPIPPVLLQPSKWLSIYEDFVTKNASSVGQVESALRSLTYIIPGEMLFDLTLQLLKKLTNTFYQGDTASQRYPQNVVSVTLYLPLSAPADTPCSTLRCAVVIAIP